MDLNSEKGLYIGTNPSMQNVAFDLKRKTPERNSIHVGSIGVGKTTTIASEFANEWRDSLKGD